MTNRLYLMLLLMYLEMRAAVAVVEFEREHSSNHHPLFSINQSINQIDTKTHSYYRHHRSLAVAVDRHLRHSHSPEPPILNRYDEIRSMFQ